MTPRTPTSSPSRRPGGEDERSPTRFQRVERIRPAVAGRCLGCRAASSFLPRRVRFKRKLTFARHRGNRADGTRACRPSAPTASGADHLGFRDGRSLRGPFPVRTRTARVCLPLAGDRLAWTCPRPGTPITRSAHDGRPAISLKGVASAAGDPHEGGDDIVSVLGGGRRSPSRPIRTQARQHRSMAAAYPQGEEVPGLGYYDSRPLSSTGAGLGSTTASTLAEWSRSQPTGWCRCFPCEVVSFEPGASANGSSRLVFVATRSRFSTRTRLTSTTPRLVRRAARELLTDGGPRPYCSTSRATSWSMKRAAPSTSFAYPTAATGASSSRRRTLSRRTTFFEPTGLFVSWNQMYARRQGRVALIPLRAIAARL